MRAKTPMHKMLLGLGILFGLIISYQLLKYLVHHENLREQGDQAISVATAKVTSEEWHSQFTAAGSTLALKGVEVVAEVDGLIRKIFVESNQEVKEGDVLFQFNIDPDVATLKSLQADAQLAELIYKRGQAEYDFHAVSKEALQMDEYDWKTKKALADAQQAVIDQKTIRAPFDGKLGIMDLQLGQFISAGDGLITLQQLDPLRVLFYVPEHRLQQLSMGAKVSISTDSYPNRTFPGKVTAINPIVDADTRNVQVEAVIANPKSELLPGMYARVEITSGEAKKLLTIPQSAVSYNPYGNLVYVVGTEDDHENEHEKDHEKKSTKVKHSKQGKHKKGDLYVKERFVELGQMRGDQVVVLKGLNEGDEIVSSGQLKLRNNTRVIINNDVMPSNDANPKVENE